MSEDDGVRMMGDAVNSVQHYRDYEGLAGWHVEGPIVSDVGQYQMFAARITRPGYEDISGECAVCKNADTSNVYRAILGLLRELSALAKQAVLKRMTGVNA